MRRARSADADQIAAHGQHRDADAIHRPGYAAWVAPRIESGHYLGWLAVAEGSIVGGAGAVLLDWGPTRANPGGRMARLANVFVDPTWRRRGLARELTRAVMRDCEAVGIREFNLAASADAAALYVELGFTPYPAEMRRRVAGD